MSEILIDITRLLGQALEGKLPTGVDRVTLAYVAHFRDQAKALVRYGARWLILDASDSKRIFDTLLTPTPRSSWVIRWRIGINYWLRWQHHKEPALLFNLNHSGLDQPSYAREIVRRKWKPYFFLHDLIPITHPEYNRPDEAKKHQKRLQTMLSTGYGIIVNSQVTENDVRTFVHDHHLSLPPCLCASLAPATLPPPSPRRPLEKPYFVVIGTIEPRKNHLLLLKIWRELVQELGANTPQLVIIGRRGWECEQVVDMLERCAQIQPYIIEKSNCEDAELATWLAHARALLFPSFVEGYGIPLVESLMLGVPVIASDLPVFREFAYYIPEYIHPLDAMTWKRMILAYAADDSPEHAAQKQRLQGYTQTSWEEHFVKVETFMHTLGETV